MFVIDRIKFGMFQQSQKMWKLYGDRAARFEQLAESGYEVVEIRNVREDVVADDEIGCAVLAFQTLRGLHAEERDLRSYPACDCRCRDVCRGLDAEHGDVTLRETPQQVPVIAADFDDETALVELEQLQHARRVVCDVRFPRFRKRRKIDVVAENRLRRRELGKLHEPAALTDERAEGKTVLRLCELLTGEQCIGKRRQTEIDHDVTERGAAEAANGIHAVRAPSKRSICASTSARASSPDT